MRLVLAITVLAACGGARTAPPTGPVKPAGTVDPHGAHEAGVAAAVQPLIDAEIVKSIVVGLYDAGTIEIYGFGAGPGGKPPTGQTLFEIGSITKVFTSILLADSVQRREVDLETPVAELLPPGVTAPTREDKVITLRDLAVHSSGLPRLPPSLRHAATEGDP
jgi:CubicO group peptidase (beta-lactamase class C family)